MQHDELIWSLIAHGHCSFRAKIALESAFCRNEYNVTGLCNRSSCPLANSRYATVRERDGVVYLYMKTIERAHSPKNLWERVPLSKNYLAALAQLDEQLAHWPQYLIHKNKQRLTKIVQYLIRMRKLEKASASAPTLAVVNKKEERRDIVREGKALAAAHIERSIERELLARLKQGTYGDIYNFPEAQYGKALEQAEGEFEEGEGAAAAAEGGGGGAKRKRNEGEGGEEESEEDEEDEESDEDGAGGPGLLEFIEGDSDEEEEEAAAGAGGGRAGGGRAGGGYPRSEVVSDSDDDLELDEEESRDYAALQRRAEEGGDVEDGAGAPPSRGRGGGAGVGAGAGAGGRSVSFAAGGGGGRSAGGASKRARGSAVAQKPQQRPRVVVEYEHEPAAGAAAMEPGRFGRGGSSQ